MSAWTPPPFDPTGECTCTPRHSPRLMVVETHHILPLSWLGADVPTNKVRVCPNTHYGTHALLNEYVHHNGTPPPTVLVLYTKPAQLLAALAWKQRITGHPTPYWLTEHTHQGVKAMHTLSVYARRRFVIGPRRFGWRLIHANGNIVATDGSQGFSRSIDAETAARNVVDGRYAGGYIITHEGPVD